MTETEHRNVKVHEMRRQATTLLVAGAVGLAVLTTDAAAQASKMEQVRQALPADAVDRIVQVVDRVGDTGVPSEPLLDKALEGAAKGVPPDRIVATVTAYAGRLEQAARVLQTPNPDRHELVAAADALRKGVPSEAVRDVGRRSGPTAAAALVVLADLVEAGVPADQAMSVVDQALRQGRRGESLFSLSSVVRRLLRQGTSPHVAATAVARVMAGQPVPAGVPPVQLPPATDVPGGPPVPPGTGPPGETAGSPPPNEGGGQPRMQVGSPRIPGGG